MATKILTPKVIDFNAALAARMARPFQARLLRKVATGMAPGDRAKVCEAVADGYLSGRSTQDIVRSILRDQVQRLALRCESDRA